MTNEADLRRSLADVRRAYRLLHAFQLRVHSLFRDVDTTMGEEGLKWREWLPYGGSSRPTHGKFFERGRSAWDLLPGRAIASVWADDRPRVPARTVRLVLVVDSAAQDWQPNQVPDPGQPDWTDAAESRTLLNMDLMRTEGRLAAPEEVPNRDWDWSRAAWKAVPAGIDNLPMRFAPDPESSCTVERRQIDLASLVDATAVDTHVHGPLRSWCEAGGV